MARQPCLASLTALVLGNEVLDAMPVHIIEVAPAASQSAASRSPAANFNGNHDPPPALCSPLLQALALPPGLCHRNKSGRAVAFVATLAAALERGVALFIDYGFPAREYYHAQRSTRHA